MKTINFIALYFMQNEHKKRKYR